ncbi:hypothetical protein N7463_010154 [Penicillium fimorum]|uniref:Uncharacterized protein n=1 Tax=Penicillium fimorum TaxID=1882269 RepID=A0A9W9XJC6_9EURO|nr:hypothetical protein N7463_010154 [Penicillium fimorum]
MYIIGNSETSIHVPMWAQVVKILKQDQNIGKFLELQCPRHPDIPIAVSMPEDFPKFSPEGGCNLRCISRLGCGHACIQKCHSDLFHNTVFCLERCPRSFSGCNHLRPKRCGDLCPEKCMVNLYQKHITLPCGHERLNLPCWQAQDIPEVRCQHNVAAPYLVDTCARRCVITASPGDLRTSQPTMKIASNCVTGIILHAPMLAAFPVTVISHILHAKLLAKCTVAILCVHKNVTSRVLLAQKKNVFQYALIASAQCHVQPLVIMFHVPSDARRSWIVATSTRQYVEKNVLHPPSAKPAGMRTSETIKWILSRVKHIKKSTWARTHAYSPNVGIS